MPLTVTKRDIVFLGIAICIVTTFVLMAEWGFPLDDSWIHQTYGRNLGLHGQWAFILGEPSAASTSPLYTVLLAVGYLLRVPYLLWTHALGIMALAICAMLGARLADHAMPQLNSGGWWVGIGILLTWHLIWAAASGMETMLFGMLTLALIHAAWYERDPQRQHTRNPLLRRGVLFGILTALTTLARPEGVMIGGIIALLMLIVQPQGNLKNVMIFGVGAALGFFLLMSPYLWLNWQLTGGLLPNTANAKFEQHAILLQQPYPQRFGELLLSILAGGQFLSLIGIPAYLWAQFRQHTPRTALYLSLPLIIATAHIALYAARLPATYQHGRYVMPALPALMVGGVVGVVYLNHITTRGHALPRIGARVLLLSYITVALAFLPTGLEVYQNDVAVINAEMVTTAHYIRDHIPPDDLMAIHDIGAVGYFAPREMIDIAGLVTPDIIPIVDDGDALWQYMQAANVRYLMAFPDQIPGNDRTDTRLCLLFTPDAEITIRMRGTANASMAVYRLAYDGNCES